MPETSIDSASFLPKSSSYQCHRALLGRCMIHPVNRRLNPHVRLMGKKITIQLHLTSADNWKRSAFGKGRNGSPAALVLCFTHFKWFNMFGTYIWKLKTFQTTNLRTAGSELTTNKRPWYKLDKWPSNGHSMVVQWLFNGRAMVAQWLFNGYSMVIKWLFNGYSMVIQWLFIINI